MVQIKRDILSPNAPNVPGQQMTPLYITVHNTANTSKGADAEMHAKYLHNGADGRQASWHYTVDDQEIWQTLENDQQGWHAGDGSGSGNTESIGIEICENSDGDFERAVENAQWLINKLMDDHDIPIDNVVTHKYWSGKECPRRLLPEWDEFIDGISEQGSFEECYKVQIGAFKNRENAEETAREVDEKGFDHLIIYENELYKVQIGVYTQFENAKSCAEKAEKHGFDVYIVREEQERGQTVLLED